MMQSSASPVSNIIIAKVEMASSAIKGACQTPGA